MPITINFTVTKINNDTLIVKDSNSGWGVLPSAKLVLSIRDKIYVNGSFEEQIKNIVLYDPDATELDDIDTPVADQIAGTLFTQYNSESGLTLTATQLYGDTDFHDSFYQLSIESPAVDITAATKSVYVVNEMRAIGMFQAAYLDRPYDNRLVALNAVMPWHLADSCELLVNQNDSITFYNFLGFIQRNYK